MSVFKNSILIFVVSFTLFSCLKNDDEITNEDDTEAFNVIANLYVSNNTDGNITVFDFTAGAGVFSRSILTNSSDAEGIYHDKETDLLVQVSREPSLLNAYENFSSVQDGNTVNPLFSSQEDLGSPRDIAVRGDFYVVSDNSDLDGDTTTEEGRFFIYTKTDTGFNLRNTVTVDFSVWGIEFVGNDLFAVVDKTADVVSFLDFAATNTVDAMITPTKRITIGGLLRTHGITYSGTTMVLTDIGDSESDRDGAFHIVDGFVSKFNSLNDGETLSASAQSRVSGNLTRLGNPVSVAFDDDSRTIFIAERLNNGGRVLFFSNVDTGGNIAPSFSGDLSGASSLHFDFVN